MYKNRTPNIADVHFDLYGQVVPHVCPHIYPRFPMHVFVCSHRVSYHTNYLHLFYLLVILMHIVIYGVVPHLIV